MVQKVFKRVFTFCFLIGAFCTLLFLGNWQLQRLEWKESVLADIAKQEATDPMTNALDLSNIQEFQRGFIEGRFMQAKPIRLAPRTHDGQVGYHLIQPFQTTDNDTLLVNMGWVSNDEEFVSFDTRLTKIAGYMKSPDPKGQFTPANFPDQNQWYFIDFDTIEKQTNLSIKDRILYLESPVSDIPKTFVGLPKPRNNHAQYAAFWFGMAGLLVLLSGLRYWQSRRVSAVAK